VRRRVAFAFEDLTEKMNSTFEELRPPSTIVDTYPPRRCRSWRHFSPIRMRCCDA
jgi:hypothetical protein